MNFTLILFSTVTMATASLAGKNPESIDPERYCAGLEKTSGTTYSACLDYVKEANLKNQNQKPASVPTAPSTPEPGSNGAR